MSRILYNVCFSITLMEMTILNSELDDWIRRYLVKNDWYFQNICKFYNIMLYGEIIDD